MWKSLGHQTITKGKKDTNTVAAPGETSFPTFNSDVDRKENKKKSSSLSNRSNDFVTKMRTE